MSALAERHDLNGDRPASGPSTILWDVVENTRETMRFMRQHLLAQLRSKAQLSVFVKVVDHLRRFYVQWDSPLPVGPDDPPGVDQMDPETRLRTEYLACRDAWHSREVEAVAGPSEKQLLKVIDLQRSQWADIQRQYNRLFRRAPSAAATAAAGAGASAASRALSPSSVASGGSVTSEAAAAASAHHHVVDLLLHRWISRRVQWFLALLVRSLPGVSDGSALASIMEQSMYLASRCGVFGADFRPLLVPVFQTHIETVAQEQLAEAAAAFKARLLAWTWAYHPAMDVDGQTDVAPGDDDLRPPRMLLAHLPAAELVNAVLGAFNTLRVCLPAPVVPTVKRAYAALAGTVTGAFAAARVADRAKARASAGTTASTAGAADAAADQRLQALEQVVEGTALPYLERCLAAVTHTPPPVPPRSTPAPRASPAPSASPPAVPATSPVAASPLAVDTAASTVPTAPTPAPLPSPPVPSSTPPPA